MFATLGLALILWQVLSPGPPVLEIRKPEPTGFQLVTTQPLDPRLAVRTQPGAVLIITSSTLTVATVESRQAPDSFREVTDEELLLLCAGRPVALVRHHPHEADLLFLNPEDSLGFPLQ
jgi:hypothetical protein